MLTIDDYKDYMDHWTHYGQDYEALGRVPLSRYYTMRFAFEWFRSNKGKVIVELGTMRSFRHEGPGCNEPQDTWWNPRDAESWDWGSGMFSRMAAICLWDMAPEIHTVDISEEHMRRARVMSYDYERFFHYHIQDSVEYLKNFGAAIDLLYLDTGDITPIEPSAGLQLAEVRELAGRELLSKHGVILIDDVRNMTPRKFGETSDLGKSKYSIPYLEREGYQRLMDEFQVVMKR